MSPNLIQALVVLGVFALVIVFTLVAVFQRVKRMLEGVAGSPGQLMGAGDPRLERLRQFRADVRQSLGDVRKSEARGGSERARSARVLPAEVIFDGIPVLAAADAPNAGMKRVAFDQGPASFESRITSFDGSAPRSAVPGPDAEARLAERLAEGKAQFPGHHELGKIEDHALGVIEDHAMGAINAGRSVHASRPDAVQLASIGVESGTPVTEAPRATAGKTFSLPTRLSPLKNAFAAFEIFGTPRALAPYRSPDEA